MKKGIIGAMALSLAATAGADILDVNIRSANNRRYFDIYYSSGQFFGGYAGLNRFYVPYELSGCAPTGRRYGYRYTIQGEQTLPEIQERAPQARTPKPNPCRAVEEVANQFGMYLAFGAKIGAKFVQFECGIDCVDSKGKRRLTAFDFHDSNPPHPVQHFDTEGMSKEEIRTEVMKRMPCANAYTEDSVSYRREKQPIKERPEPTPYQERMPELEMSEERPPTEATSENEIITPRTIGYNSRINDPRQMPIEAAKILERALSDGYHTNYGIKFNGVPADLVVTDSQELSVFAYNFKDGRLGETSRNGAMLIDDMTVKGFCEKIIRPLKEKGMIIKNFGCSD